jgi:hypothetical protein
MLHPMVGWLVEVLLALVGWPSARKVVIILFSIEVHSTVYHGSILLTTASEYLYYQCSCMLTYLLIYICFILMVFYALLMLLTFATCLCISVYAYSFLCLLMHAYVCYLFAYES